MKQIHLTNSGARQTTTFRDGHSIFTRKRFARLQWIAIAINGRYLKRGWQVTGLFTGNKHRQISERNDNVCELLKNVSTANARCPLDHCDIVTDKSAQWRHPPPHRLLLFEIIVFKNINLPPDTLHNALCVSVQNARSCLDSIEEQLTCRSALKRTDRRNTTENYLLRHRA